jgi:hypothetical protein
VIERYFKTYPKFSSFRYYLPTSYKHLIVILRDRIATSEFVDAFNTESSKEWPSDIPLDTEEGNESKGVRESIERSGSIILTINKKRKLTIVKKK